MSAAPAGGGLRVTDLHHCYGTREVLQGITLHAPKGTVLALIGASGSG